jgi:hypothetical protein
MNLWRQSSKDPDVPEPREDQLARLNAKADLIVEELGDVVSQLGELLRRKYGND